MVPYLLVIIIIQLFLVMLALYYLLYNRKSLIGSYGKKSNEQTQAKVFKDTQVKYRSSGMSDALRKDFMEKLLVLFQMEQPYLNPDLKLNDVARSLNLTRHQTSQIINQSFNLDFNSFLNYHRIEHAKKLIEKNQFKNINDLVYDSGFNNATSFNKSFKKFTGLTPREYISKASS